MMNGRKKALVIGASEEAEYAIRSAQRRGYFVTAVDGNPEAKGLAFADKSIIADITDSDCLIKSIGGYQPQVVLPVPIGRYLTATGVINDYYNLKGVSEKSAILCTDKYSFHQILHQNGLRDGECLLISAGESWQNAIDRCDEYLKNTSYESLILKPRYGSGSRAVSMISVGENVADYLEYSPVIDEDMLLEPAYPGHEYGVDGIVCDGTLNLILLREKIISEAPYRQAIAYIANHVGDEQFEIARDYLQKVVSLLGFKYCVIHCDLMWDGEVFRIIEISARPSGHNLHNLFVPTVTGINMIDCFIDICEGRGQECIHKRGGDEVFLIGYFDHQEGTLLSLPPSEAIVEKFANSMVAFRMEMNPGYIERSKEGHGLMSRGYFIIKGDSREDVLNTREKMLDYVFADFEEEK